MLKFKGVRDEPLILKYKENRDDDIEIELIERYKIHSRKLASELYQNFKFVFQVEYEDLYSIALANLFVAIKYFRKDLSFFKLWKKVATNEIKIYVSSLPLLKYQSSSDFILTSRDKDMNESSMILASPSLEESTIDLSSDIEKMILRNSNVFKKEDVDIYILYISGYSYLDIANITGLKYHYVRSRVVLIREQIKKYFVHS